MKETSSAPVQPNRANDRKVARRAASRRPSRPQLGPRLRLELLEDRLAPAATPAGTHFAVIGDYGSAGSAELSVANLVNSWNPDFVITTGDNNYATPSAANYDLNVGQYFHSFIGSYTGTYGAGAATNAFFPTLGEHDWASPGDASYLSYFTLPNNGRYYTVTEGPVQLFAIDSNVSEPNGNWSTSVEAAWLKSALAASTAPWKIVYFSEAPYSSGSTHGNSTWMQWPFQQWGASAVLSGHEHNYERLNVNGLPYFVNGLGGASIYPFGTPLSTSQVRYNADYGAMQVTASPSTITFQFVNEAGTVIDSYTMNYALPAAPSGLTATAVSGSQIGLTWTINDTNATNYNIQRSTDGVTFSTLAGVGPGVSHYVDSGLTSSQTYYYQVNAANAGGASAYSAVANSTPIQTTPTSDTPSNLGATASSPTQINLTWTDNSSGLDSFVIARSTDGSSYTQIATVAAGTTTYSDTGLTPGTYFYRVLGSNTGGSTVPTAAVSATLVPAAPSGLTATVASPYEIDLAWTSNSTNQTGFAVSRSTDGVNFTQVATVGPSVTTYSDIGLSPFTKYYYQVSAVDSAGQASSGTVSATTNPAVPPAIPTSLTATAISASKISLSWTETDPSATSYNVYRSTDGVTFTNTNQVNGSTATITGLSPSTTYYFEITAVNVAGESGKSSSASAATMALPAAPSSLTATAASAYTIKLNWTSNTGGTESGFNIYRSTDNVNFTMTNTAGTGVTTWNMNGLSPSTTYYFQVTAISTAGESVRSNTASTATMTLPVAPSNLTATPVNASKITLSWTSNTGGTESGFNIYRSTDNVNFTLTNTAGTGVTTWNMNGLSQATTYYFQVTSFNAAGESGKSNTANATTYAVPGAPSGLTATAKTASKITLTWTSNSGGTESGFNIYRSTDNVKFTLTNTAGVGVTTWNMSGLSQSTTYYFQVTAFNAYGSSSASNTASATTMALPAAPTNLTAVAVNSTKITLTWTSNSGGTESGFQIYRSTDGVNFTNTNTAGTGVTTWNMGNLSASTTYYFQVRSYTAAGNSNPSNTASSTTPSATLPTTAPAAPSGLTATAVSSSQINLAWSSLASNQDEIEIQQSTDGTNFTTVGTAGANLTGYSVTGLSASTQYYYQIYAHNTAGSSGLSGSVNATTTAASGGGSHLVAGDVGLAPQEPVLGGVGQTLGWSAIIGASATVNVYILDPNGDMTANERARVQDAINTLDVTYNSAAGTGLQLVLVTDPSLANIVVENTDTTQSGGQADGLLGDTELSYSLDDNNGGASYQLDNGNTYLQFAGQVMVNVVNGWNWYDGSDPTAIGSTQYDYGTVVLHEIGHAVGLYHDLTSYTGLNDGYDAMYPSLDQGVVRRNISSYDVAWLNHLYANGADPGSNGTPGLIDGLYVNGAASVAWLGSTAALTGNSSPNPVAATAVHSLTPTPAAPLLPPALQAFNTVPLPVGLAHPESLAMLMATSLAAAETHPGVAAPTDVASAASVQLAASNRIESGGTSKVENTWTDRFAENVQAPVEQAPVPAPASDADTLPPTPSNDRNADAIVSGRSRAGELAAIYPSEADQAFVFGDWSAPASLAWAEETVSTPNAAAAAGLLLALSGWKAQREESPERKRRLGK